MRTTYKSVAGCVAIFISVCTATPAFAACDVGQNSLGAFYNDIRTWERPNTAQLTITFADDAESEAGLEISREGFEDAVTAEVRFTHTLPTDAQQQSTTIAFKGLLLTAKASLNAVDLAQTHPNHAFKLGHSLVRISLGDAGAVVLIPKADYESCSSNPNLIYILPESAEGIDDRLNARILSLADEHWETLISSILRLNSGNRLSGNTIEEVLDKSGERTTAANRQRALSKPIDVEIRSRIDFAALEGPSAVMPTIHDNFDYVHHVAADPASVEIRRNAANMGRYFAGKYILRDKIRNGTVTDEELEAELEKIQKLILETRALIPLAGKNLEKARWQATQYGHEDPDYVQNAAVLERERGTLEGNIIPLSRDYEALYKILKKVPVIALGPNFDRAALSGSHYVADHLPCDLTAQMSSISNTSVDFFGQKLNLAGEMFVTYSPAKDPVTGHELVRMLTVLALNMPNLSRVHHDVINSRIPSSSCRHRYGDGREYSQTASKGQLLGSSKVTYQKWICESHFWICFKGWIPRTCKNEIKTRVFRTDNIVRFIVSSYLSRRKTDTGEEVTEISLEGNSNFGFSDKETFPLSSVTGNNDIWSTLSDTANAKWLAIGFSNEPATGGKPLLILRGETKLVRPNSACGMHEMIGEMIK